jgi:type I restriction enzyme, R subunit
MNVEELNKKSLSERDICTKFITPALVEAGWDVCSSSARGIYFY